MMFLIRSGRDGSRVIEVVKSRSASYKVVDNYGRRIIIAWPDKLVEDIVDEDVELKVKPKRKFYLVSNEWKSKTVFDVDGVEVGGKRVVVIAGPCAVEDYEQMLEVAKAVKRVGGAMIRGGAYKPRTSPYSFQGLGVEGLKILKKVKEAVGLPIVSEVMDTRNLGLVAEYIDMLQIGARNAQNFVLLREVGKLRKPVLLKRGFGLTVEEWLLSAEYILAEGNGSVALCERGIRTFENSTRFTIDIGGMVAAKGMTHLPVGADPSHPAGKKEYVEALALAAIAAGADIVMVEVHPEPGNAMSDSEQQLTVKEFEILMEKIKAVATAVGRSI
ncbi:MAG: 3-deoxy-7-phosphoheptulonate synthase [Ignisphaera sp.]|uniref:3-deoxy-7-phosphoheptulonate synthase n=1 Tax=Ignisphaera aggregans TaxID=334771 RepID=A0A7C4NIN3_9CREN